MSEGRESGGNGIGWSSGAGKLPKARNRKSTRGYICGGDHRCLFRQTRFECNRQAATPSLLFSSAIGGLGPPSIPREKFCGHLFLILSVIERERGAAQMRWRRHWSRRNSAAVGISWRFHVYISDDNVIKQ